MGRIVCANCHLANNKPVDIEVSQVVFPKIDF